MDQQAVSAETMFLGGGDMGALMRAMDWSRTPLGPVESWPQSLRTSVSTCLDCAFPILIWWGPQLVKIYNDEYRQILGREKHPAALGAPGEQVWPEIWDVIGPMLEQVLRKGEATRSRDLLLVMNRNGYDEETYFSFSYSPIRDETGGVGGVFTPVIETTERVIGERRLDTLRELAGAAGAASVAQAVGAALAVLSRNRRDVPFALLYALPAGGEACLVESMGLPPGVPAAPSRIDPAQESPWPIAAAAQSRQPQQVQPLPELSGLDFGDWPAPQTALAIPLVPAGRDAVTHVLVAGVNPRRALDEAHLAFFQLLARQIGQILADAMTLEDERRRAVALAELDAAKTRFFSNVSHEFRTPLTLMLGPLEEILAHGDLPVDARRRAETAHRNSLRLLRLVNRLLDFSRMEAGRLQATFAPADLGPTTAEIASSFTPLFERAGLRFVVEAQPLPAPVHIDRSLWERVVLNLVSNAFKFTLQGEVRVSVAPSADGAFAELRVADTGLGIPEAERPRLFERFHRVEATGGRSFEGSGIGLALVRELVGLHGGTVEVDSREGVGSIFTVRLPFGAAHLPQERLAAPDAVAGGSSQDLFLDEASGWLEPAPAGADAVVPAAAGARVLVADDNADMRAYIGRLLLADGLEVIAADDGEAAFEAALQTRPDLVVSDIMMPRLDGLGLLQKLRREPSLAATPIILLSARAGEDDKVAGVAAGADDYVAKPFSSRELVARVRTQIALHRNRREAMAAVEASERRMRLAQQAAGIAAWELDLATGESRGAASPLLSGLPPASGWEALVESVHPEDRARFRRALDEATSAKVPLSVEVRAVEPHSGEVRWIALRSEVHASQDGASRLIGVSSDITLQRRAELELRRLNEDLEAEVRRRTADRDRLWRLSADLMLVAALDGRILDVNPAWEAILGWAPSDLIERSYLDFVHPDDVEATRAESRSLAGGRITLRFENRYRTRDGDWRWITWTATPEDGIVHAVGRDVTEDKEAAERLEAAESLLRQAQKMEAIGQLTGGIAHDFNNLLGAMVGSFDLIQSHPDDVERVRRFAQTGLAAAERGARLTAQLLTFSRAQRLQLRPVDVSALVLGMREMLARTLGPMVRIEMDPGRPGLSVLSDEVQLEMAVLNLAINARDAMPDGGDLILQVSEQTVVDDPEIEPGPFVMIRVTDSGVGMPPEVAARALDPFFTTKGVGKGTGLGLSQVYGLARQAGGTVRIETAPGQGATVRLLLPRTLGAAASPDPDRRGGGPPAEGRRVLVIDDDPDVRRIVVAGLESAGHEVVEASDGRAGLEAMDRAPPDLVILDFAMPEMNGAEVAREIRQRRPRTPIIFVSGYADTAALEAVTDAKTGLLRKPFRLSELQAAAATALTPGEPTAV